MDSNTLRAFTPLAAILMLVCHEPAYADELRFGKGTTVALSECEGDKNCATWKFAAGKAHVQWSDGVSADLNVVRSDAESVVIIRTDAASGTTKGQTALYQGVLIGNRLEGTVIWSWPGHREKGYTIGDWSALLENAAPRASNATLISSAPAQMHLCNSGSCSNIERKGNHYENQSGTAFIVRSFTHDSIVLLRADPPNQYFHRGLTFAYRGKMTDDGKSMANGLQVNTWGNGGGPGNPIRLSWGQDLAALPGSGPPPSDPKASTQTNSSAAAGGLPSQGKPPQQASPAPQSQQSAATAPIPNTDVHAFQLPAETKSNNLQSLPVRMTACEVDWCAQGGTGPALWTFSGSTGHGSWGESTEATLTVEKFDSTGIVIRRTDTAGKTKGMTATLRGQLSDRYIVGDEYLSWPGHWEDGKSFTWSAQAALPPSGRRVSIKGNWQAPNNWRTPQGRPVGIRIEEDGDRVTGWLLGENGAPQFEGHFAANTIIEGRSRDQQKGGEVRWVPQKLYLDDPDHLAQRDNPSLFSVFRASADPDSLPCDRANSFHATPNFAFLRGRLALANHNDFANAACWLRIAALQGHARAEAMLASQIYNGQGVTQSDSLAFEWARSSAERNDILGEMLLAALYKEGKGVAADPKQYEYWNSRVKQRRSDQLWALLDKKTPIGLTGREAIGAAFSLATKIADSTDWILGPECHRWEDGHCIQ